MFAVMVNACLQFDAPHCVDFVEMPNGKCTEESYVYGRLWNTLARCRRMNGSEQEEAILYVKGHN